ncbi:MAG: carbonic anhydrase [Myxococcales bacterium]
MLKSIALPAAQVVSTLAVLLILVLKQSPSAAAAEGERPAEHEAPAAKSHEAEPGPAKPTASETKLAMAGEAHGDGAKQGEAAKAAEPAKNKEADKQEEKAKPGAAAAKGHGSEHEAPAGGPDAEGIATALLAGNARFMEGSATARDLTADRQRLATGQHPKAMILTCSDSRVPPEILFDQGLGDLFVVRTAGNVADPVAVGSLEYAAEHLHAPLLMVLGHERCGAVTAAASGEKMPTKNLEAVVARIAPSVAASKGWAKGPALVQMAAEQNVRRTADELVKQSPVLKKLIAEGKVTVVRAMYDLDTGKVSPLGP